MPTANDILAVARGWIGYSERNGKFLEILNVYNAHKPLARGYPMKETDDWCDCFVSAVAIRANAVELIGTEVGCERHIDIFKEKGIWIEDGTATPEPGDIICYDWNTSTQPNDGFADHIGYVEEVLGDTIVCIEGNKGEEVSRRYIKIGWGYIRGFARPKYSSEGEESMDFANWTDEQVDALLLRIGQRLNQLPVSDYAAEASAKGVACGFFADGDGDGFLDNPQAHLKRQDLAVVLNKAGLFETNNPKMRLL